MRQYTALNEAQATAIIRALAEDGARIEWEGDTLTIENPGDTVTVVVERRRREAEGRQS